MTYTLSELLVFREIVRGNHNITTISLTIKKTKSQVYRVLSSLIKKKLIYKDKLNYKLTSYKFAYILGNILKNSPKIANYLTNSKIIILNNLISKSTVKKICNKTNLSKAYVSKFIKSAYYSSILLKDKNKYFINSTHWSELIDFLNEYNDFNNIFDERVPVGAIIYYKNKNEIIFSYEKELDWASPTAFTIFKNYDLLIYSNTGYYYLPKKKLTKKDILLHTLKIVEKTKDFRQRLYLALFYYKYKSEFKNIKHNILNNLNKIFNNKKIDGYPPLREIKEKAKIYNIKM